MIYTSTPLMISQLQNQLSKNILSFGFEEKMESGSLDTVNVWKETLAAAGSVTGGVAITFDTGVNVGGIASEESVRLFPLSTILSGSGDSFIFEDCVIEWMAYVDSVANIDNTTFIMGIVNGVGHTRASANAAGFILDTDKLYTLTDHTGTDETNDISTGITLAAYNVYKIIFKGSSWEFYVNGVLKSTHTAQLPTGSKYLAFYLGNDAAASAKLYVQYIRVWYEDKRY